mmetsp:Transcript_25828/g.38193  ORF Transcript_25828/g.38193 Transcript_25828/m.38193 type:complete len:880 (-) Transcript_25828:3196-5835(-)
MEEEEMNCSVGVVCTNAMDTSAITSPLSVKTKNTEERVTPSSRDDLLALAQQKFDEVRRKMREYARDSRTSIGSRRMQRLHSNISYPNQQLLSTLLYLSLMIHKVEELKMMLKHDESDSYHEWHLLLNTLHSPVFYLQERKLQNERTKRMYERKQHYKNSLEETDKKLREYKCRLSAVQAESREIGKQMSDSISKLTDENKEVHRLLQQKQKVESDLALYTAEAENLRVQVKDLEKQLVNCREEQKKLNETNSVLQSDLSKNSAEGGMLKSQVGKMKKELERIGEQHTECIKEKNEFEKKSSLLQQEVVHLNEEKTIKESYVKKIESEMDAMRKDLRSMEQKINAAKKENYVASAQYQGEIDVSKAKGVVLESSLEKVNKHLQDTQEKLNNLHDKYNGETVKASKELCDVRKQVEAAQLEQKFVREELERAYQNLESTKDAHTKTQEALNSDQKIKEQIKQTIDAKDNEISRLNELLNKQRQSSIDFQQKCVSIKGVNSGLKTELEERVAEIQRAKGALVENAALADSSEKEISALNTALEMSKAEINSLKNSILCANALKDEVAVRADLSRREVTSLETSLKELKTENGALKESLLCANALKDEVSSRAELSRKEITALEISLKEVQAENKALKNSILSANAIKDEVKLRAELSEKEVAELKSSLKKIQAENNDLKEAALHVTTLKEATEQLRRSSKIIAFGNNDGKAVLSKGNSDGSTIFSQQLQEEENNFSEEGVNSSEDLHFDKISKEPIDMISSPEDNKDPIGMISSTEDGNESTDMRSSTEDSKEPINMTSITDDSKDPIDMLSSTEDSTELIDMLSGTEENKDLIDMISSTEEGCQSSEGEENQLESVTHVFAVKMVKNVMESVVQSVLSSA